MRVACLLFGLFISLCFAEETSFTIGTKFAFGLYGGGVAQDFAADTADRYGVNANWRGLQIPLETARNYENIDPFFTLYLGGQYRDLKVWFNCPLRKDLEAWYEDDTHSNTTLEPSHLDINVPTEAYAEWTYGVGVFKIGRFKPDLGPSSNTLVLGGAPYHDAILWSFHPSIFRYDFFLSSLNAHLHGTPATVGATVTDTTTEVWQQAHNQVDNQRNRSYTEAYKTLVYHRLGVDLGFAWLYVIEQSVIGGKQVEFRTMNPFMFWHDNYASGYTKANFTFELGLRPITGSSFYWQMGIDDLKSPVGETDENSTRSILSFLVGYQQEIPTEKWGVFTTRLDVVYTDPAYGNERLPLLKYTSRRMYRSNYRDQDDEDFADMFYVDYPLGYRRGPDAIDLWFDLDWKRKNHAAKLEFAWLRQGDKELYDDYDEAVQCSSPLSGIVETQYVVDLVYRWQALERLELHLGGGGRLYENLDHEKGEDGADFWLKTGVTWDISYTKKL
ncbi:MAG: hypothetical protein WCX75_08305 [Fibrobacteraceae bacterium]